jgi:hypothetical protein
MKMRKCLPTRLMPCIFRAQIKLNLTCLEIYRTGVCVANNLQQYKQCNRQPIQHEAKKRNLLELPICPCFRHILRSNIIVSTDFFLVRPPDLQHKHERANDSFISVITEPNAVVLVEYVLYFCDPSI